MYTLQKMDNTLPHNPRLQADYGECMTMGDRDMLQANYDEWERSPNEQTASAYWKTDDMMRQKREQCLVEKSRRKLEEKAANLATTSAQLATAMQANKQASQSAPVQINWLYIGAAIVVILILLYMWGYIGAPEGFMPFRSGPVIYVAPSETNSPNYARGVRDWFARYR
jgi:hypothetical protein